MLVFRGVNSGILKLLTLHHEAFGCLSRVETDNLRWVMGEFSPGCGTGVFGVITDPHTLTIHGTGMFTYMNG